MKKQNGFGLKKKLVASGVGVALAAGAFVATFRETSPYEFGPPCVVENQVKVTIEGAGDKQWVVPWHKGALLPLQAALAYADRISDYEPDLFVTAYACRDIRGYPGQKSLHSWPIAIDFDPAQNGMGVPTHLTELGREPEFVKAFKRFLFRWGGDWTSRPDAMHFEYRGVPIPVLTTIQPAEKLSWVPKELRAALNHAGNEYGLDPRLLAAVAERESGFDPAAVSSAGAVGLMQLMPFHCEDIDCTKSWQNVHRGARILASYIELKGSVRGGLAAYNVGPYQTDPDKLEHGQVYASNVLAVYWRKVGPVGRLRMLLVALGFEVYKRGPYRGIEVEAIELVQQQYHIVKVDGLGVVGPGVWTYLFNIEDNQ